MATNASPKTFSNNSRRQTKDASIAQRKALTALVGKFTALSRKIKDEMQRNQVEFVGLCKASSFDTVDGKPLFWIIGIWKTPQGENESRWVNFYLVRSFMTTHILYSEVPEGKGVEQVQEHTPEQTIKFLEWLTGKLASSWEMHTQKPA